MTVGLYLLRAKQMGLSLDEMGALEIGEIFDMATEMSNDSYNYPIKATQADFDRIFR